MQEEGLEFVDAGSFLHVLLFSILSHPETRVAFWQMVESWRRRRRRRREGEVFSSREGGG